MKKIISFLLSVVLLLSLVPVLPVTQAEAANYTNRGFTTLRKEKSTIAPGITQEIGTVRKQYNGQQLVYYTMTVNTNVQTAKIYANYKDNDGTAHMQGKYGLQAVKAQMDAAQKKHSNPEDAEHYIENYTVVGGINGTGYNMSTGQTRNLLVMEGVEIQEHLTPNEPFFAILKDGTPYIGWNDDEYQQIKSNVQEALGGFQNRALIKNSVIQQCDWGGTTPDCNARTAIGINENTGEVVMLVVDGKQAPYSEGCDMYELAEILQKAGCTDAFNLDGGGSTTFVSRPEGEETYRVISKPCDGSPRNVSASLLVVSTAGDPNKFDRVTIDADADYITPGGTVELTAKGISAAGSPIDIPEGVTWSCTEGVGTFTSNGSTATFIAGAEQTEEDKTVTISMMQDGQSVGTFTIHVVKPNVFNLTRQKYMVPFGKSMPFEVYAAYKTTVEGEDIESEVTLHEGDVTFELDNKGLGKMEGEVFTAHADGAEGAVDSGNITATLTCNNMTSQAELGLGKGSETIIDFEDPSESVPFTSHVDKPDTLVTVKLEKASTSDGGHVHSGNNSMRVTIDYSNLYRNATTGSGSSCNLELYYNGQEMNLNGAVGFGMWIWIPEEERFNGVAPTFSGAEYYDSYQKKGMMYDEGHWEWLHMQPDVVANIENFTIKKGDPNVSALDDNYIGFWLYAADDPDIYDNMSNILTFYIDDVMVDYSQVQPDREAPTIGDVKTGNQILSRGEVFDFGKTNAVSFTAEVTEDSSFNATGIDEKSVKALIDGNEVDVSLTNSTIVVNPVTVADGVHTLKLYISDKEGNTTNQTRQFKVDAKSSIPTINVVPRNPEATRLLSSSVYYMDVKATDVATVETVELRLDLFNNMTWELEHADIDPKFEMSKPVIDQYENIATVTLTRKEAWSEGDSSTIASLPMRLWGTPYTEDQAPGWSGNNFSPRTLELDVDYGKLTCSDGSTVFFGMEHLQVSTELFGTPADIKAAYPNMTGWHNHATGKFAYKELEKVEPTCTTNGYEGRKVCTECNSPVTEADWGTVLPATGHEYELKDGVLKCTNVNNGKECGLLYNGIWEETGQLYKDGKVVEGWQDDGTYYVDGKALGAGLHQTKDTVDGKEVTRWHLFDENGVCDEDNRADAYSGYYTKDGETLTPVKELPANVDLETNEYYYLEGGLPRPGWLFFRKDGTTVDPDQSTETVPSEDEDSGETGSEGTTSETKPGVEPGMPDPDQQQAIMDIVAYHVHSDGRVHSVNYKDTRTCVVSGYMEYTCKGCGEKEQSERLWWVGHKWRDPDNGDYYCTVCETTGKNIAEASLNIMGKHFEYSGGEIRSAVYVYHDGKQLSVRSDKNGHDGYVWFENNKEIGVATVHIRGEGDYYGELVGTFEIVPQSVTTVDMTQTAASDADHVKVTLNWSQPLGAEFYDVWRYDYVKGDWIRVGKEVTDTTFSEELEVGTDYDYRVASRARDTAGNIYYSVRWSDSVNGTIRHSWGAETGKVDATCTTEGQYKHTCTLCGFTETVTVPATGHKVEEWEITEQATTSAPGERKGTCTVCGETVTEEIPQLPPVITGTGNTTSPDAKQETVTNEDGSTTTTTTKPDGSKTETTTQTDGTVTEKNTEKSGVVTETTTKPDNTVTEKVTQTDGSATEKTTTPDGVVGQKSTDADGKVTSAEVVIPKAAEKQDVVTAPVEVPAAKSAAEAPEISVRTESAESQKVEIPVTEFGPGTVAVVVHEDGTEEIVRDCVIGENGVVLNVEGDVTLKIVDNTETFEDVEPANHWASNAVEFVAARELFNGTGENKFTPNGAMTRGMMVTVLYRLAYEPDTVAEQFADVPSGQYYTDAVAWAQNAGVVTGYDDNTFAPDDNVKREQLVTILYRYAKKMGYATTASGTLAGFADASSVSSWAADAMSWAIDIGLVNGVDATHLAPANNATRAEVATILMRFCEKVVK